MNSLDYNGISLIGNIGSISNEKQLPSGKKYKYFDLCQNSKYKDRNGEEVENTSFFTVRLFEKQIEQYESIIQKGKWVHLIGRIRNYIDKDNRKVTYVTVDTLREMRPKEKINYDDIFDYDWLNDSSYEEEYGI